MTPRVAIRNLSFLGVILGSAVSVAAAQLKEARVTQVVQDVKLLPTGAAARPAAVTDEVREGTAVRTGIDSRSELKFSDQTLARLGANTIFSFNEGTRNLNLQDGAMLLRVPKGAGGAKINSSAVTAAITGTTVMVETHALTKKNTTSSKKGGYYKFIVLEGTARLYLPGHLGESTLVKAGQMIIMQLDSKMIPEPVDVDIGKITQSSLLITGFATPIPSQNLVAYEQQKQAEQKGSGQLYDTNLVIFGAGTNVVLADPNKVDVAVSAESNAAQSPTPTPTPTPTATPTPTPSKFGTPTTISSPVPYVITSGTTITTDPTITTNGHTDFGKIWRGPAIDGPLSAFIFGSTSSFDTTSGFDTELNGQMGGAGFKFTALQLTGNPTIVTTNGEINLGLIAVNGITSGSPGGVLTFAGIRGLLLATQNGPINLGPEISFSGLHDMTIYARGAASDLLLGSDLNTSSEVHLYAERDISVSSNITTEQFTAVAGRDLTINAFNAVTVSLSAANNLNWSGGTFSATGVDSSGDLSVSAGQAINITNDLVEHRFTARPVGANISFDAGTDLSVGGQLDLRTSVGSDSGGNVSVAAAQDVTVGGLLFLRSNIRFDATSGNEIMLNVGGTVSAGSLSGGVSVEQTNSALGTGGNISIQTGNDLTITGAAPLLTGGVGIDLAIIPGEAALGGVGSINTGGNIHLHRWRQTYDAGGRVA